MYVTDIYILTLQPSRISKAVFSDWSRRVNRKQPNDEATTENSSDEHDKRKNCMLSLNYHLTVSEFLNTVNILKG